MKNVNAIELVIFKFKTGVNDHKALEIFEALNEVLKTYPGFVSRQFAKSMDDTWMDMVYWKTMEQAKFAADNIMKNPKALELFAYIDEQQMSCYHFTPQTNVVNQ